MTNWLLSKPFVLPMPDLGEHLRLTEITILGMKVITSVDIAPGDVLMLAVDADSLRPKVVKLTGLEPPTP